MYVLKVIPIIIIQSTHHHLKRVLLHQGVHEEALKATIISSVTVKANTHNDQDDHVVKVPEDDRVQAEGVNVNALVNAAEYISNSIVHQ